MFNAIHSYFNQSISRLVMASFVVVLLFPLGFLTLSLPEESWGGVKKEVMEKQMLIADSIGESINLYFLSFQKASQIFANTANITTVTESEELLNLLDGYIKTIDNVIVVSYLSLDDYSKVISIKDSYKKPLANPNAVVEETDLAYLSFGNRHHNISTVSPVFRSTVSLQPAVLIKTYVFDKQFKKRAILFTEVGLSYINEICEKINVSGKEHCIVVDSSGKVASHPNPKWVDSIENLSRLKIVQNIKNGKSGTLSYHAPYLEEDAVAGFTSIDKLGWGVIIAQPKLELDNPLKQVMLTILKWLVLGIILALAIAYLLTRQITKPINSLVTKSLEADIRSDNFNLGKIPKNSPLEICQLWSAITSLVTRLQEMNKKVVKMNLSLNKDIEKATEKLRAANKYLYAISSKDHLTRIANRRYFEDTVEKTIKNNIGERASIILIDVDKFKFINDEYGHEAGDLALIHIAKLMHQCTRKGDLPARLGGDEFVIFVRNCGPKALEKVAETLRKTVEESPIFWEGTQVNLSLSVGTVNAEIDDETSLAQLLKYADEAMYDSKEHGRNHVSAYSFESATLIEAKSEIEEVTEVEV